MPKAVAETTAGDDSAALLRRMLPAGAVHGTDGDGVAMAVADGFCDDDCVDENGGDGDGSDGDGDGDGDGEGDGDRDSDAHACMLHEGLSEEKTGAPVCATRVTLLGELSTRKVLAEDAARRKTV
jgi:hypothetical protein